MAACTLCGVADADESGPSAWIAVEVSGTDDDGCSWWIYEYFCTQAHAAEWLTRPLVHPYPSPPFVMTTRDRVVGGGLAIGAGLACGLAGLGALTAIKFLVSHL